MKSQTIGSVKLNYLEERAEKFMYSDGDIEDKILQLFKNGLTHKQRKKILNSNPDWATRYHLSYERGNLLNWYEFKENSRVLEVGSGMGAITEVLVKNEVKVVANELSPRRASVNAYRNKQAKNLEIVVGNLQDYKPKEKFDYVICVGVLEYAGTFIHSANPYKDFVKFLNTFLKPGGVVLIAIENKLGMKYFAGAREDHTRRYFDGLNNYPQRLEVKTFGKTELAKLIESSGFHIKQFYYPYPDYKLPQVVYSDNFLPGIKTTIPKSKFPAPNFDQPREFLFSESQLARSLEKNKIYDNFANSFLVEAINNSPENKHRKSREVIFSQTATSRADNFKIRTNAFKDFDTGEIIFRKEALTPLSVPHLNRMLDTYKILKKQIDRSNLLKIAKPLQIDKTKGVIEFSHIEGISVENLLLDALLEDDLGAAGQIIKKFTEILQLFSTDNIRNQKASVSSSKYFGKKEILEFEPERVISTGLMDLNLDNFIIDNYGQWWLIDYEWRFDVLIPTDFIKHRSMLYFFSRHKPMIQSRCNHTEILINNILSVPQVLVNEGYIALDKLDLAHIIENKYLQPSIFGSKYEFPSPENYTTAKEEVYYMDSIEHEVVSLGGRVHSLELEKINLKEELVNLEDHINRIRSSRAYKISSSLAKAKRIIKPSK